MRLEWCAGIINGSCSTNFSGSEMIFSRFGITDLLKFGQLPDSAAFEVVAVHRRKESSHCSHWMEIDRGTFSWFPEGPGSMVERRERAVSFIATKAKQRAGGHQRMLHSRARQSGNTVQ